MQKPRQFEVTDFKNADEFFERTGLHGIAAVEFLLKELKKLKSKE